jgi:hypothetical protein
MSIVWSVFTGIVVAVAIVASKLAAIENEVVELLLLIAILPWAKNG